MATSSRKHFSQQHWIQYLLPVQTLTEAQNLGRRFQEGGGFHAYVLQRKLLIAPAILSILLMSVSCAVAPVVYLSEMHALLALPALLLVPAILIGSLLVQLYVFFSWLENRSLEHALGHPIKPAPRSLAAWLSKKTGRNLGTLPRIPWVLAAIILVAPLLMLASFAVEAALVLIVVSVAAPVAFSMLDR